MRGFTPHRTAFIRGLAQKLAAAGVRYPAYEAARFVIENPEMEHTWTIDAAAEEWLSCAEDAAEWRDPARYGAS